MIKMNFIVNDEEDLKKLLKSFHLEFKRSWKNWIWLKKRDYYRLIIFDNGEYGLFTQSQAVIIKNHQELNSANWADYKKWADEGYMEMRPNGVKAGTEEDHSWTPMRKKAFRETAPWKDFKRCMIYWNKGSNNMIMCEDCKKYFNEECIDVHHIEPDSYDLLERRFFMLLCRDCHSIRTKRGE